MRIKKEVVCTNNIINDKLKKLKCAKRRGPCAFEKITYIGEITNIKAMYNAGLLKNRASGVYLHKYGWGNE